MTIVAQTAIVHTNASDRYSGNLLSRLPNELSDTGPSCRERILTTLTGCSP